jgi:hypothetical protein
LMVVVWLIATIGYLSVTIMSHETYLPGVIRFR